MQDGPQTTFPFPTPKFETWRYLALGACLLAMFWPLVRAITLWAGSDSLLTLNNPYPSVWVAAFVFGALVGRMDAIYIAFVGLLIAVVVSVGLSESDFGGGDEDFFYIKSPNLATSLSQLALPWLWIAVFAGLGALVSTRLKLLLGFPRI